MSGTFLAAENLTWLLLASSRSHKCVWNRVFSEITFLSFFFTRRLFEKRPCSQYVHLTCHVCWCGLFFSLSVDQQLTRDKGVCSVSNANALLHARWRACVSVCSLNTPYLPSVLSPACPRHPTPLSALYPLSTQPLVFLFLLDFSASCVTRESWLVTHSRLFQSGFEVESVSGKHAQFQIEFWVIFIWVKSALLVIFFFFFLKDVIF